MNPPTAIETKIVCMLCIFEVISKVKTAPSTAVNAVSKFRKSAFDFEVSSKGMWPWEVACCLIDEEDRPKIRVRSLSNVNRNVLLFHECIHAIRARFCAPQFEEYIGRHYF